MYKKHVQKKQPFFFVFFIFFRVQKTTAKNKHTEKTSAENRREKQQIKYRKQNENKGTEKTTLWLCNCSRQKRLARNFGLCEQKTSEYKPQKHLKMKTEVKTIQILGSEFSIKKTTRTH